MVGDGRAVVEVGRGVVAGSERAGAGCAAVIRAHVEQQLILDEVLAGVELGAWDQRMVGWLAGWDAATVLTIASWIVRAREMGPVR